MTAAFHHALTGHTQIHLMLSLAEDVAIHHLFIPDLTSHLQQLEPSEGMCLVHSHTQEQLFQKVRQTSF